MRTFNTSRKRVALLVLLLCSTLAHAVDGRRDASQYLRQAWGLAQGMPGMVNALAQTPDGYLWVGTDNGLYRFDGRAFVAMSSPDPDIGPIDHVRALVADSQGTLWIWMQATTLINFDGAFHRARHGADDMRITAMARAQDDGIVLSTLNRGIVHLTRDRIQQPSPFRGALTISVAQGTDGRVWVGTRDLGLGVLRDGHVVPAQGAPPDRKINCLLPSPHGQVWVGTDSGLSLWNGHALTTEPFPAPLDSAQIFTLVLDRDANLWAGTSRGLVRLNATGATVLPTASPITSALEDREGNLWFGGPAGIERLRDSTFAIFSAGAAIPGPLFVDSAHRLWVAPKSGGLSWTRDGVTHPVTAYGLANDVVYSISGSGNNLWLGRQFGGVTHFILTGDSVSANTFDLRDGRRNCVVATTLITRETSTNSAWFGTLTCGLFRYTGGKLTRFTEADGLAPGSISALAEDDQGTLYAGSPTAVSLLEAGRWHTLDRVAGLPLGEVTTLYKDRNNTVWVAARSGLAYIASGTLHKVATEKALLHEPVLGMTEDMDGWLWFSTPDHIFKVRAEALLRGPVNDGDLQVFDEADGLRSTSGIRRDRSVLTGADGRIWISTEGGIAVANPTALEHGMQPAIAHVEGITVDGRPVTRNGESVSAAAQKRIAFHFTGLSLRAPERVRFRYMLDGFDRGWSEATTDTEAIYTNLPPGWYRFRVKASGGDGAWSETPAVYGVRIAPLFWQTWWFRLACVLLLLFLAVLLYQIRMRALVRRSQQMLEERLTERTRIAQELHDTLLQGFFSASMQLRVIADREPQNSEARPQLNRILLLMGRVMDQGRDAVKGLRSSSDDSVWLEDACRDIAREMASDEDIAFTITSDGGERELRPGVQMEVLRIVQESLNNAAHHAQAARVEVIIRYQPQALRVTIRDNGVGIPAEIIAHGREGHWGLPGMRERAATLGGQLHVTSGVGTGTAVELRVPANAAYRRYSRNPLVNWIIEVYRARPQARRS